MKRLGQFKKLINEDRKMYIFEQYICNAHWLFDSNFLAQSEFSLLKRARKELGLIQVETVKFKLGLESSEKIQVTPRNLTFLLKPSEPALISINSSELKKPGIVSFYAEGESDKLKFARLDLGQIKINLDIEFFPALISSPNLRLDFTNAESAIYAYLNNVLAFIIMPLNPRKTMKNPTKIEVSYAKK